MRNSREKAQKAQKNQEKGRTPEGWVTVASG
jgi:hypothetical protein